MAIVNDIWADALGEWVLAEEKPMEVGEAADQELLKEDSEQKEDHEGKTAEVESKCDRDDE